MEDPVKNSLLIVDDERQNLFLLSHILGGDYRIYTAKDGQEAILKARELKPDLILLDIIMPGMSGYHVIGELKGMPETKDIPVVFVTGLDSDEDEEYGLELGAADYIYKPIGKGITRKRVGNQIAIVNLTRALEQTQRSQP